MPVTVIEHVPNPRRLLREIARVARRFIYVEVPCELHLRTTRRALQRTLDIGHINAYTPESLQLLVETSDSIWRASECSITARQCIGFMRRRPRRRYSCPSGADVCG